MYLDVKQILGDCWRWQRYVLYYLLLSYMLSMKLLNIMSSHV